MLQSEKNQVLQESQNALILLPPRWLRLPDVVKYSGIGRSIVYKLMGERKIKSHTIGTIRVVDRESIDAFIESQPA